MKVYAFTATFLGVGDSEAEAWVDGRCQLYLDDDMKPAHTELLGDHVDPPAEEVQVPS